MVPACSATGEHFRRMLKESAQQGPSKRRDESYLVPYFEPLSETRTKLAGFFSILIAELSRYGG
jgi:hypothetical protein